MFNDREANFQQDSFFLAIASVRTNTKWSKHRCWKTSSQPGRQAVQVQFSIYPTIKYVAAEAKDVQMPVNLVVYSNSECIMPLLVLTLSPFVH